MYEFYNVKKTLPTLKLVHNALQDDIKYSGSKNLLKKWLSRLGLCWKSTGDNKRVLVERKAVMSQRLAFYARKGILKERGFKQLVWGWSFSGHSLHNEDVLKRSGYAWSSFAVQPRATLDCSTRWIMPRISRRSFANLQSIMFNKNIHREVNAADFRKWITEKLLPNLKCLCAIVMANDKFSLCSDREISDV